MKKMTCRQMGGACDTEITGATADELHENGKKHVHEAQDEGHKAIVEKMKAMSDEDYKAWKTDFDSKFEALPEA